MGCGGAGVKDPKHGKSAGKSAPAKNLGALKPLVLKTKTQELVKPEDVLNMCQHKDLAKELQLQQKLMGEQVDLRSVGPCSDFLTLPFPGTVSVSTL